MNAVLFNVVLAYDLRDKFPLPRLWNEEVKKKLLAVRTLAEQPLAYELGAVFQPKEDWPYTVLTVQVWDPKEHAKHARVDDGSVYACQYLGRSGELSEQMRTLVRASEKVRGAFSFNPEEREDPNVYGLCPGCRYVIRTAGGRYPDNADRQRPDGPAIERTCLHVTFPLSHIDAMPVKCARVAVLAHIFARLMGMPAGTIHAAVVRLDGGAKKWPDRFARLAIDEHLKTADDFKNLTDEEAMAAFTFEELP